MSLSPNLKPYNSSRQNTVRNTRTVNIRDKKKNNSSASKWKHPWKAVISYEESTHHGATQSWFNSIAVFILCPCNKSSYKCYHNFSWIYIAKACHLPLTTTTSTSAIIWRTLSLWWHTNSLVAWILINTLASISLCFQAFAAPQGTPIMLFCICMGCTVMWGSSVYQCLWGG